MQLVATDTSPSGESCPGEIFWGIRTGNVGGLAEFVRGVSGRKCPLELSPRS